MGRVLRGPGQARAAGAAVRFQRCSIFDATVADGSYDLVYDCGCFRPEGGSGYTDQQVYERGSLGGGLGYSAAALRALWDTGPFSLRVLRQMRKTDGQEPRFGEDFLWVLLATKAGT